MTFSSFWTLVFVSSEGDSEVLVQETADLSDMLTCLSLHSQLNSQATHVFKALCVQSTL